MSRPVLFYTDHYTLPLPEGHRFPMAKYRMTRERLAATGRFELRPAPFADVAAIKRVHDPEYVDAVLAGTLPAAAQRRIGFPWSQGFVERTLASAGSTLAATEQALRDGWSGTLSGGTHHAFRAEGSGFCVFNDIAIAARKLLDDGRVQRIAVVDLDVHQGDGTAEIFAGSEQVFTLSLHCRVNFPFRKQQSTLDVELEEGLGDDAYLAALRDALKALRAFAPEFIFYQGGVDVLASDALGKLELSPEGVRERDRMVFQFVKELATPLVITQGGGYSKPIELTAEAHAATYMTALEVFGR
jgi:acetoin utilization deacetylase AcuC-like enzyme